MATMDLGLAAADVPILECRNLTVAYAGRRGLIPAVTDFNLTLLRGEAHGLVGESGCGKSTIALAIMRHLGRSGRIVQGQILFQGRDMATMGREELRRIRGAAIAMIYQEPMASWRRDRHDLSRTDGVFESVDDHR